MISMADNLKIHVTHFLGQPAWSHMSDAQR